uniref:hypothetical protein n=1 Tax=Vibrio cholerae TaxID=666 RepID=UPI003F582A27
MCAVFLTTTHEPPPVIMVFIMGGILFITAWFQALMSEAADSLCACLLPVLFGIFYWCMERTKKNPQDVFAILLIVSTAMIAVFTQQKGISVEQIPMALLKNIFIAGFTAYLAYWLFPGGEPLATSAAPVASTTKYLLDWQTLFKAIIVMTMMVCTIQLDLEQSTIITIVVALMIKDLTLVLAKIMA